MKKLKRIFSLLLVLLFVATGVGCSCAGCIGERVRIQAISAVYNQTETVYDNESLSVIPERGTLTVTLEYTNGKSAPIAYGYTLSGNLQEGNCEIAVLYADAYRATITVRVTKAQSDPQPSQKTLSGISALYSQTQAVYVGSPVDSVLQSGELTVHALYSDGSREKLSDGYTLSGTLAVGVSTVTVSYGGYNASFTVLVSEAKAAGLAVTYTQTGTIRAGSELSAIEAAGTLQVQLVFSTGDRQTVTQGYVLSGSLAAAGTAQITVSYQGYSAVFTVTVTASAQVSGISASYAQSDVLFAGYHTVNDMEDKGTLTVTVLYSDGSSAPLTDGYELSGSFQRAGTVWVSVQYNGATARVSVTVTDPFAPLGNAAVRIGCNYGVDTTNGYYSVCADCTYSQDRNLGYMWFSDGTFLYYVDLVEYYEYGTLVLTDYMPIIESGAYVGAYTFYDKHFRATKFMTNSYFTFDGTSADGVEYYYNSVSADMLFTFAEYCGLSSSDISGVRLTLDTVTGLLSFSVTGAGGSEVANGYFCDYGGVPAAHDYYVAVYMGELVTIEPS